MTLSLDFGEKCQKNDPERIKHTFSLLLLLLTHTYNHNTCVSDLLS